LAHVIGSFSDQNDHSVVFNKSMNKFKPSPQKQFVALMLLLSVLLITGPGLAAPVNQVRIHLDVSADQQWTITYQTEQPVTRLAFFRPSDDTRSNRWKPFSADFTISAALDEASGVYHESIQRTDGVPFTSAAFVLTPTYQHIPKEYAPFSPFSDGGMLAYTGRLMACADQCQDSESDWRFSIQAPEAVHIIVNGKQHQSVASWSDGSEGKNIYVGKQQPVTVKGGLALIDPGLPEVIKDQLNSELPAIVDYFAAKLGTYRGERMTLFASYAKVSGQSAQGGTLPNQIFMHWNMNDLHEKTGNDHFVDQLLWFFAHEVAHLFQRSAGVNTFGDAHESWIHEGHAEYTAALALSGLYPKAAQFVELKENSLKNECLAGLEHTSLPDAARDGQFRLYYSCGFHLHQYLDTACRQQADASFELWNTYRTLKEQAAGQTPATELFFKAVSQMCSADLADEIRAVFSTDDGSPAERFAVLFKEL
jgi:hypothetical protein